MIRGTYRLSRSVLHRAGQFEIAPAGADRHPDAVDVSLGLNVIETTMLMPLF